MKHDQENDVKISSVEADRELFRILLSFPARWRITRISRLSTRLLQFDGLEFRKDVFQVLQIGVRVMLETKLDYSLVAYQRIGTLRSELGKELDEELSEFLKHQLTLDNSRHDILLFKDDWFRLWFRFFEHLIEHFFIPG